MKNDSVCKTNKGYLTWDYLRSDDSSKWFADDINNEMVLPFDSEFSYDKLNTIIEMAKLEKCEVVKR